MLSLDTQVRIKRGIKDYFATERPLENLQVDHKEDNSVVTNVDNHICRFVKSELAKEDGLKDFTYYSEEDHHKLEFPCCILDPIDGTSGLLKGVNESALSLGIMKDSRIENGWGMIFNPFTGYCQTSDDPFYHLKKASQGGPFLGLVSRSEWERGLFTQIREDHLTFIPKGSIAFKLGLLASGGCDFVLTRRPKNIWDIAGVTILCHQRGINLFDSSGKIEILDKKKLSSPMLWCREDHFEIYKGLLK